MADFSSELKAFSENGLASLLEVIEKPIAVELEYALAFLSSVPYNPLTEEVYSGRNGSRLWIESRKIQASEFTAGKHVVDPRFMTFEQVKEYSEKIGKQCGVKPGAKAINIIVPGHSSLRLTEFELEEAKKALGKGKPVVIIRGSHARAKLTIYPKHIQSRQTVSDGGEVWKILSGFTNMKVFSCKDMYGVPSLDISQKPVVSKFQEVIRQLCQTIDVKLVESNEVNECLYNPEQKIIFIPEASRFLIEGAFERSFLHEFYHATATTLERDSLNLERKAQEEAEAELFSLFLGDALKIQGMQKRLNSVEYIKNWSSFAGKNAGAMVWECMGNVITAMEITKVLFEKNKQMELVPMSF